MPATESTGYLRYQDPIEKARNRLQAFKIIEVLTYNLERNSPSYAVAVIASSNFSITMRQLPSAEHVIVLLCELARRKIFHFPFLSSCEYSLAIILPYGPWSATLKQTAKWWKRERQICWFKMVFIMTATK